jgi:glycosyltransferase involved in cell wall biosynthesis
VIIGHYDSELWARGGVANYVQKIGQAQQAAGHQVYYFSLQSQHDLANIPFSPFIAVANQAALFAKAAALNLDILHVHKAIDSSLADNLPIIRTVHGHHPYCPSGSQYLQRWHRPCERTYSLAGCLRGYFFDRCGSVRPHNIQDNFRHTQSERRTLPIIPTLTVSNFLKERMLAAGYPENSVQTLYLFANAARHSDSPPNSGKPHFLFFGRLSPQKGVNFLLKALSKVHTPVHLNIAGDGEDLPQLKRLVEKLQLQPQVTFHGWLDQPELLALIRQSRAVIFPSCWHEPAGLVTLEAAANSRAVIATQVGGVVEYAKMLENTILIESGDVGALAEKIDYLAQDWGFANQLGQQGRENLDALLPLAKHYEALMCAYENIIASRNNSRVPMLNI